MDNLIKSFCLIVVSVLGMGISYKMSLGLPVLGDVLLCFFGVFDFAVIVLLLYNSRSCLFGLFCTYVPFFFVILYTFSSWQFYDACVKFCIIAIGCSFFIVILGMPLWGLIFLYERFKKLYSCT